jgi:hypothetical protein
MLQYFRPAPPQTVAGHSFARLLDRKLGLSARPERVVGCRGGSRRWRRQNRARGNPKNQFQLLPFFVQVSAASKLKLSMINFRYWFGLSRRRSRVRAPSLSPLNQSFKMIVRPDAIVALRPRLFRLRPLPKERLMA